MSSRLFGAVNNSYRHTRNTGDSRLPSQSSTDQTIRESYYRYCVSYHQQDHQRHPPGLRERDTRYLMVTRDAKSETLPDDHYGYVHLEQDSLYDIHADGTAAGKQAEQI